MISSIQFTHVGIQYMTVPLISPQRPDNGIQRLPENLLLFRHDPAAATVLQLINSVTDVTPLSLVEIVVSGESGFTGDGVRYWGTL